MSSSPDQLVLPRPGATSGSQQKAIQGPTEASFVEAFGQLLPSAQFLITDIGKAAYFEFPPLSEDSCSRPQSRVLLIHGVQTPALGLLPLIRNLQKISPHAHFVVVDLWGHGLSDTPLAPHDAALFHHLLDTLLDHLAWSSVHLIGYSFGGSLTAGYVTLRSSRLQSFTLVAPAGLIPLSMFSAEEQDIFLGNDEVAAKNWILGWLEGGDLVVPTDWKERVAKGEVVAEAVREWEVREHPGHAASVVGIFRDGGVMDNHAKFLTAARTGIPSLAILGELDTICSEARLNEQGFGNVTTLPQVGHGVVRERASEVAGLISGFWKEISTRTEQR